MPYYITFKKNQKKRLANGKSQLSFLHQMCNQSLEDSFHNVTYLLTQK